MTIRTRPTPDELRALHAEMGTAAAVSRYLGISEKTGVRWCRDAGIDVRRGKPQPDEWAAAPPAPKPAPVRKRAQVRPAKRGATTATGRPIARLDPAARAVVDGWLAGFRAHCARRREEALL